MKYKSADFGNVKNQLTLKCKKPVNFWKCKQPVTIPLRFPKNSQRIPKFMYCKLWSYKQVWTCNPRFIKMK